jgi:hypothetical protein
MDANICELWYIKREQSTSCSSHFAFGGKYYRYTLDRGFDREKNF